MTKLISPDVVLGEGVVVRDFVNLYGCVIGEGTQIGPFVEIQRGAQVGPRCKISSHTFICEGVKIGADVFIGHGVMFTNDRYPRAADSDGQLLRAGDWKLEPSVVERGASIGSGCVILPGVTIGARAIIGAGSVITRDVPADSVAYGNPAKVRRTL